MGKDSVPKVVYAAAYVGGFSLLFLLSGFSGAPIRGKPLKTLATVASASSSTTTPAVEPSWSAPLPAASASIAAPSPRWVIDASSRVLVLGDSMADSGFSQRMAALVKARGGRLESDAWTSATTTTWSQGDRLEKLLALVKPTHVLVVLGANEVFLPKPESLAPFVRAIVGQVSARPCAWVTPPLWKGETGIVAVTKANAAPCRFFDSSTVSVARRKDGIHPNEQGGADWADAVWASFVAAGAE